MTATTPPSPEEIVLYHKDPETRIATITLNRPEHLNAPTIGARLRYASLLHAANFDDDVKVLVIRGAGENLGSGADLPELAALQAESPETALQAELELGGMEVTFPPRQSYRASASLGQWYADPRSGCRTLADFKKISIVEVKGYCYGMPTW
jgi:enoyl-CoA hydratase/carnithine racemase